MLIADYATSLHWADRLSSATIPYASADNTVEEALSAYHQVEKRWGSRTETRLGIARCLGALGNFEDALETLKSDTSPKAQQEKKRLQDSRWVKAESSMLLGVPARQVLEVDSGRWLALGATETEESGMVSIKQARLGLFRRTAPQTLEPVAPLKYLQVPGHEAEYVRLSLVNLTDRGDKAAVALFRFMAADAMPTLQHVYRIAPTGPQWLADFRGMGAADQLRAKDGRLVIRVSATWKIWWPDLYEWRNGRFQFANARYPEFYDLTPREFSPNYYPHLLQEAARRCIAKRYDDAERILREAEGACLKSLQQSLIKESDRNWDYYDPGWYGNTRVNLQQIRLRLRLLRRRDYNQRILVRPYDFDLQVPPYALGPSRR